jgi:tRNA dimethylallyltransferase
VAADALPVVFLMGPTASGKTDLAVELVRRAPFAIVSVDSAMVYRGMDIGTAKPSREVLAQAPHRLIDIRAPQETYSAADFRRDALAAIADIHARRQVPLLVGGTMLYFKALRDGLSALPAADPEIRARLEEELAGQGIEALAARLAAVDPAAAALHGRNPQRLVRALEVVEITGRPLSELQAEAAPRAPFPWPLFQLALPGPDPAALRARIAARFRAMLAEGFEAEVRGLLAGGLDPGAPALRAVGYRQMAGFIAGQLSYDDMVERAIIATCQLAKRQRTWLRSWDSLSWLDPGVADLAGHALDQLARNGFRFP